MTLVLYYTNTDSRLMSIQAAGIFVLCWSITYTSSFLPFIILVLYSFSSFLPLAIFCISAIPLTLPCAVSISGLHIPFSLAAFLNIYQFLFIYLFLNWLYLNFMLPKHSLRYRNFTNINHEQVLKQKDPKIALCRKVFVIVCTQWQQDEPCPELCIK